MNDIASALTSGGGVTPEELQQLIALGRAKGALHLDGVLEVLKDLDLTPDIFLGIQAWLQREGIELDESFADEVDERRTRSSADAVGVDAVDADDDADDDDDDGIEAV